METAPLPDPAADPADDGLCAGRADDRRLSGLHLGAVDHRRRAAAPHRCRAELYVQPGVRSAQFRLWRGAQLHPRRDHCPGQLHADAPVQPTVTKRGVLVMISASRRQQRWFNLTILVVLCIGAVIAITPMLYMTATAFKANAYVQEFPPRLIPENPTLENFQIAFTSRNFGQAFLNSAVVAVSTMLLVTALTTMMAYAFARYEFRGKNFLFYSMLGMM